MEQTMEQTKEQTKEQIIETIEFKFMSLKTLYEQVVAFKPKEYELNQGAYQSEMQAIVDDFILYNDIISKINKSIDELIPELEDYLKQHSKKVVGGRRNKKRTRRHKKKRGKKMRATRTKH